MTAATKPRLTEDEDEQVRMASEAKYLLDNPMLKAALEAMESEWDDIWKKTDAQDIKTREFAYRMLYAARKFKSLLTTIVESGRLSEIQLATREQSQKMLEED